MEGTMCINVDKFDLYGEKSVFRSVINLYVRNLVSEGKWFGFCTGSGGLQYDLMSIVNKSGDKLGTLVAKNYPDSVYRIAIYKYLLKGYLCYYESPTVVKDTKQGYGFKSSYDKYLVTSSIGVIALWLGVSHSEAFDKYGSLLGTVTEDDGEGFFPYVKLYISKEGIRKVTKPRALLDLHRGGIRVTPLFALSEGVSTLYKIASKGTYDVTFIKDGGQKRTINTTFNTDIIKDLYKGSEDFIQKGLYGMYDGNFLENPNLVRGYIRVFELGSSIYDSPMRAINFARIVEIKPAEPDLTYVHIDLDGVISTFLSGISTTNVDIPYLVDTLDMFDVGSPKELNGVRVCTREQLETWVLKQEVLYSTVFLRSLALFMIGNPQWFKGYTGKPKEYSSSDYKLNNSFEGVFDLDIE